MTKTKAVFLSLAYVIASIVIVIVLALVCMSVVYYGIQALIFVSGHIGVWCTLAIIFIGFFWRYQYVEMMYPDRHKDTWENPDDV